MPESITDELVDIDNVAARLFPDLVEKTQRSDAFSDPPAQGASPFESRLNPIEPRAPLQKI